MELCYANNEKSLFRKYARLVTWFARTGIGSDYLGVPKDTILMLPNGYHQGDGRNNRLTLTTRAIYAPKLWKALVAVDRVSGWITDFDEATRLLVWQLGLTRQIPDITRAISFSETTFNPDANVETTSVDGAAWYGTGGATFTVLRDGSGSGSQDDSANAITPLVDCASLENQYGTMTRGIFLFDTSSLTAGATLSDAIFSTYVTAKASNLGQSIWMVDSSPNENILIGNYDYEGNYTDITAQSDTKPAVSGISTSAYLDFTCNSTGLGNVSKTSITKYGLKMSADATNTAPTWINGVGDSITINFADNGSNEPKLVVTYIVSGILVGEI